MGEKEAGLQPSAQRPPASAIPRSPGTGVRLLLFLLALAAGAIALALLFPPAVRDRPPALLAALALALLTVRRPDWGIAGFAFLFPCAGLAARLLGSVVPTAWPVLLFAGLAIGWTFRFLYDFESQPKPSRADPWLRCLLGIWTLGMALAVAQARTLWAAFHGLSGRAVNGAGLWEVTAIRESVLSFCVLASGVCFFFLLRRCPDATRRRALKAALLGVGVSAASALLQRLEVLPAETHSFWRMTGRLSGGAVDPNSLGLLCALALVVLLPALTYAKLRLVLFPAVALAVAAGLLLSGSRSGFLVLLAAAPVLLFFRRFPSRSRLAGVAAAIAVLAVLLLWIGWGRPGTLPGRVAQTFDSELPLEYRVSERPALWRSAVRLFRQSPIQGAGVGAFSWRLPDLLREQNRTLPMRDNPGSAYLQALAETGLVGFVITLGVVLSLGRQGARLIAAAVSGSFDVGAGVAVIAFSIALLLGSHWLAPDVSLFFFLLAANVALPPEVSEARWKKALRTTAVAGFALACAAAILATARPEVTFRHDRLIGFHRTEHGSGGPFRWTRRDFAIWVESGESFPLRLVYFSPGIDPVVVTASAGDRTLFRRSLVPGEAVSVLLKGAAGRPTPFLFHLSRTFVPKRLGLSDDRRELGLVAMMTP